MAAEHGAAAAYLRMAAAMKQRAEDAKRLGNTGLFDAFVKKVAELEEMAQSMAGKGATGMA